MSQTNARIRIIYFRVYEPSILEATSAYVSLSISLSNNKVMQTDFSPMTSSTRSKRVLSLTSQSFVEVMST